jgi:hypothetical protein
MEHGNSSLVRHPEAGVVTRAGVSVQYESAAWSSKQVVMNNRPRRPVFRQHSDLQKQPKKGQHNTETRTVHNTRAIEWNRGDGKKCFQNPTPSRGITMPFINAEVADNYHMRPAGHLSIPFLLS